MMGFVGLAVSGFVLFCGGMLIYLREKGAPAAAGLLGFIYVGGGLFSLALLFEPTLSNEGRCCVSRFERLNTP